MLALSTMAKRGIFFAATGNFRRVLSYITDMSVRVNPKLNEKMDIRINCGYLGSCFCQKIIYPQGASDQNDGHGFADRNRV